MENTENCAAARLTKIEALGEVEVTCTRETYDAEEKTEVRSAEECASKKKLEELEGMGEVEAECIREIYKVEQDTKESTEQKRGRLT